MDKKINDSQKIEHLISTTHKSKSIIKKHLEGDIEDYYKELDQCLKSIDNIKKRYYANDAALERIRSRSFLEILQVRLEELTKRADAGLIKDENISNK